MNQDTRLFRNVVTKPPRPEEVSTRREPYVDLWNIREQRRGYALCELAFFGGEPEVIFQMIEGCGTGFTHWRWA